MIHKIHKAVFIDTAYVTQPFIRNTVAQEVAVSDLGEQQRLRLDLLSCFHDSWNGDFPNRLSHLNQLGSPGLRVNLQLTALGPLVGVIVVVHVTKNYAFRAPVQDYPDIEIHAH